MSRPELQVEQLQAAFPEAKAEAGKAFGPELLLGSVEQLVAVCEQLKTAQEFGLEVLEDYTALDTGEQFILVLRLTSNQIITRKLTVKVSISRAGAKVPTLCPVYGSAEWYEREIFDMFGIRFSGHPDMRRILLPDEWKGHPLRKDYKDERMLKRPGA
ncbi:NADH-quinone oxidoreductase subunit C [bacterium]|nr:NADH-quinone oxidoreductase subunit C [bacterium]